jgi:tetratricopeptide (TPR) repeat protein
VEAITGRHAAYFLDLVEAIPYWTLLSGPDQLDLLAGLEQEHDNLRAALRWFITHRDVERAYRLAGSLGRFWFLQGHLAEGRAWLAELLADAEAAVTALARAKVVYAAALLAWLQGDFAAAAPLTRESLALWRTLDRPREEAYSLHVLGLIALRTGDRAQAHDWFEQALATSRTAPNPEVEGLSTCYLGEMALDAGVLPRAQSLARRALEVARRIGHPRLKSQALCLLGEVRHQQGEQSEAAALLEAGVAEARGVGAWWTAWALTRQAAVAAPVDRPQARAAAAESLQLAHRLGDQLRMAQAIEVFALLAANPLEPERVLRLDAAALALRRNGGSARSQREQSALDPVRATALAAVPAEVRAALDSRARAMSPDQVVADALETDR